MRPVRYFSGLLFVALAFPGGGDSGFCTMSNTTLRAGETINLKIYYAVSDLYFSGGDAVFSVNLEKWNDKTVYHITGKGKTNAFVDNAFKVRDSYETYIDTGTLKPYKFIRNVDEGGHKIYENISFIRQAYTAITKTGVYKVPPCIQDVLSAVYNARNIDFDKYRINDKIPYSMFLDSQVYNLYIRYLGKEVIKTRYGKFHAIKFKPLLIYGTIFTGGEKMTVWISDDANHLPLRIESPISVGRISADMMGYHNLRYPLKSLISLR
jgi:hypothetical protein